MIKILVVATAIKKVKKEITINKPTKGNVMSLEEFRQLKKRTF